MMTLQVLYDSSHAIYTCGQYERAEALTERYTEMLAYRYIVLLEQDE